MSKWEISTFEAFVNKGELSIQTGPFGTQLKASDYAESGSPVINVRNIGFGIIIDDNIEYIADETRDRLSSHILRKDDIVFGRKGAVERHAFVDQKHDGWLQGSDCIRVRIESPTLRPRYASYCLLTPAHKTWMANNCSHGATMASLNQDIVKRIEIPVPETQVQDQVISMLSAYDDLIENNNRRIAILEEMAQKLYCEWFVHFRFPGHENVKMVESEVGLIPEGWEIKKAYEVLTTQYGYTETAQNAAVGPQYLRGTDINKKSYIDWSSVPYCPINSEKKKKYSLEIGDVVIIRMADPGKIGIVEEDVDAVFASYLIKLKPIKNYLTPYYLFYMTSDKAFQGFVLGASTGATRKSISAETIKEAPVLKPSYSVLMEFEERVGVFRKGLVNLLQKNANLRKTRDLLLPRLISGDIDVSDLNIPIKEG